MIIDRVLMEKGIKKHYMIKGLKKRDKDFV